MEGIQEAMSIDKKNFTAFRKIGGVRRGRPGMRLYLQIRFSYAEHQGIANHPFYKGVI